MVRQGAEGAWSILAGVRSYIGKCREGLELVHVLAAKQDVGC